ncbi:hypothetical protein Ahy_A05g021759 isoform A [Arachis hypogaea]|uniref:Uncharacterized protein n=1 Tax=Arachis hypogaea TaxID=3818 RepID=A0A445CYJ9_ARAHY|nr:hypothetical protein Ahy_A05g021759 isoform A [Arachis hypogaea]
MKPFFASIGQLWKEQKLAEKPARFVISTGTQEQLIENRVLHLAKIMRTKHRAEFQEIIKEKGNILIAMLSSAASSTADLLAKGKKSRPRWKKNGPSAVHKLGFRQIGYLVKENALLSNTVRSLDKDVSKTRKLHANAKQRE